jgi:glycosidase
MKDKKLQIMIHGENAGRMADISLNQPGITLEKITRPENSHYIFFDLNIEANATPGSFFIDYVIDGKKKRLRYELKARRKGKGTSYAQGVTARDLIYLIMPDRFSNGDPSNDRIPGMKDQSLNRDTVYNRHGGDLSGVQQHLDYLKDLGVTAIWLNPVLENDMPDRTEHGYAITDHYKVDPRLGGEKAYNNFVEAAHAQGLKVIQDAIYNHVGLYHFTVQDRPMKDWLNEWPSYTNTNYKDQVFFDPHRSEKDYRQMIKGWFTPQMPDLNQDNPFVANFLIQHAIWCVEEFGIDGWRIDTYPYNEPNFMNRCNKALLTEYPSISIFGETWVYSVISQSYFCENALKVSFKSNLPGTTDFQCLWAITDALTKNFSWRDGVNQLYNTLAQDVVYKDPMKNVIFLDNHDKDRFFTVLNEDIEKYKSALSWLFTARGIPQVYYGDEFATTGSTTPTDGHVRLDFPGGWPDDKVNKFKEAGRDERDMTIFSHFRTLANFRKGSSALTTGLMMQYIPVDGLYVYFRYSKDQTVMIAMNTSTTPKKLIFSDYAERTEGFKSYRNITEGSEGPLEDLILPSYQTVVLELKK